MGMFDSFVVVIDDHDVELQSKRFDSLLKNYRIGDVVSGAPAGVRVYFDEIALDAAGKPVYGERTSASQWTSFVALAQGVFVEHIAVPGPLDVPEIQHRIGALRERWSDSARLIDFLVRGLADKQEQVAELSGRINHARSAIGEARRLRAGEASRRPFGLASEYIQRLAAGEDALSVIEWVLGEEWPHFGPAPTRRERVDPLDEYRL